MKQILKKEEIKTFQGMLFEHRKVLAGDVTHLENNALRNSKEHAATHDISNFADLGTDYHEQELAIGLIEDSEERLRAIDNALQRIEDGTYGYCEGSAEDEKPHPVGKTRLKAIPWASYCIECQRKVEEEAEEL